MYPESQGPIGCGEIILPNQGCQIIKEIQLLAPQANPITPDAHNWGFFQEGLIIDLNGRNLFLEIGYAENSTNALTLSVGGSGKKRNESWEAGTSPWQLFSSVDAQGEVGDDYAWDAGEKAILEMRDRS